MQTQLSLPAMGVVPPQPAGSLSAPRWDAGAKPGRNLLLAGRAVRAVPDAVAVGVPQGEGLPRADLQGSSWNCNGAAADGALGEAVLEQKFLLCCLDSQTSPSPT